MKGQGARRTFGEAVGSSVSPLLCVGVCGECASSALEDFYNELYVRLIITIRIQLTFGVDWEFVRAAGAMLSLSRMETTTGPVSLEVARKL